MFSSFNQTDHRYRDAGSPGNIEPMTIGSPVSSPKNKSSANQNYLPPYLFGETASSPISSPTWHTPSKQSNISTFQSSPVINQVSQFREQHIPYQSASSSSIISTPNPVKSGGPPVQGLLYSTPNQNVSFNASQLNNTPSVADRIACDNHNFSGILTPNKSLCVTNTSYLSPAQIDPFYTQGEALQNSDQLDESWITVFGFPHASSDYILQQFSQYGNIIEHKLSPTGNWMHLRYQSKLQAKKALSKNGKVFSGNIMIGVKPCIEMDIMESCKENTVQDTSLLSSSQSVLTDPLEPTKPNLKNIRPLTQAYQSPNAQSQIVATKPSSLVSKAFDYIWKLH
ncbi:Nucleoporin NUP35 like protein [Argiope bruennichi]|uniref:Nucleoporin NUP53 n=1 Tax=Argiope bruennichi TaxID=94029 RepID=A0A8T0EMX9_ARGBR|nr:Nucleoporin NUP35 like protein [Argiope bruennichi]